MSRTHEDNVVRWIEKKMAGEMFTSADISKDTGIPTRNIGRVLARQPEGTLGYKDGVWWKSEERKQCPCK